ncbi:MAG: 4Fe-4S binding protein [Eubacteriales bacterium]|nr:4Fe-4S binding protein [Eubacteriales bacterium]MDD3073756.1 4Fe-4S binding protein [Eubacteriales bacterium]MDD4079020.1 4Fe-4S binding protein [Eubacteriales bacterium]MDD4768331.1 4Fe-4S binding protein [Eubacteriales bacterium]
MLKSSGIAQKSDWEAKLPDVNRRKSGPYVVIECYQKIPCNPCEGACPNNAVTIGEDINNIPCVDYDRCNGCGICISRCPGLAIFVVDEGFCPGFGKILIPWEYLPLPTKGAVVAGVGRDGKELCPAEVVEVRTAKNQDRTAVIGLKVPLDFVNRVRGIKLGGEENGR